MSPRLTQLSARALAPWAMPSMAAVSAVIGFAIVNPHQPNGLVWTAPAAVLSTLMGLWPERGRPLRTTVLAGLAAVALHPLLGVWFGFGVLDLLRMGVTTVLVVALLLMAYRAVLDGEGWFPKRPWQVIAYVLLTVPAGILLVVGGASPTATWGGTGALQTDVWWVIRSVPVLTFGLFVGFIWLGPEPTYTRLRYPTLMPLIAVLSVGCFVAPYAFPEEALTWLMIAPAVWLGMTLTPRLAAIAMASVVLMPAIMDSSPLSQVSDEAWIPAALQMGLVLTGTAALTFVIIVFREREEKLTHRLQGRIERGAAENALLNSVIGTVTDGVLIAEESGAVALTNPALHSLLGPPQMETAYTWLNAYGFRAADGGPLHRGTIDDLLQPPTGRFVHATLSLPGEDGPTVFAVAARTLTGQRNRPALVIFSDVTAQHARHRELEAFAGTVAHDLRNPLATLSLWMDLADADLDSDPASGADSLRRTREAGMRMQGMIDDYLTYAVTRQGVPMTASVPLGQVAREIVSMYAAGDPPPHTTVAVRDEVVVQADRALLAQLLSNLVANSVKYARPGERAVIVIRAVPDVTPDWVRVLVEDRGIGIPEEDRAGIFRPFARSAQGAATSQGIGLGLALCEAIVERHNGRISAHANAWGGTTIEFTLPSVRRWPAAELRRPE